MKNKHQHYHEKKHVNFQILGIVFIIVALGAVVSLVILWQASNVRFDRDSFPIHKY